jgi:hypothetical protein
MQVIIIHARNPMRNAGVALQSHSSAPIAQHFQPYGEVIIRTFENILTVLKTKNWPIRSSHFNQKLV